MSVHPTPPGGRHLSPAGSPARTPIPGPLSAAAASPAAPDHREAQSVSRRPVRTGDSRRDPATPCGPAPLLRTVLAFLGRARQPADSLCATGILASVRCRTSSGTRTRLDVHVVADGVAIAAEHPGPWVLTPQQVGRMRAALRSAAINHATQDLARGA